MIYYAIADLHGRLDLLEKACEAIAKDTTGDYQIITLGDYIDRGPDSKKIIKLLMEAENLNFICLQGNHEAMMVDTIRTPINPDWWIGNGGDATLKSYGGRIYEKRLDRYVTFYSGYDPHVVPLEHVEWISNLPLYYETEQQVFVHAGVPNDGPLEKQPAERLQWMLYGKEDHGGWNGKHVVHGHHQFADGPHTWSGRTNLDTYAWSTGRLVVGVFDDTQPAALRYLEVLGDDYEGKSNLS